jgi:hypothetical protein
MHVIPYTRDELEGLPADAVPERGVYCKFCRSMIPEFADITPELAETVREAGWLDRMKFACNTTGCPMLWARLWAMPLPDGHNTPPCPECGEPLMTKRAKQCLECGADWH